MILGVCDCDLSTWWAFISHVDVGRRGVLGLLTALRDGDGEGREGKAPQPAGKVQAREEAERKEELYCVLQQTAVDVTEEGLGWVCGRRLTALCA